MVEPHGPGGEAIEDAGATDYVKSLNVSNELLSISPVDGLDEPISDDALDLDADFARTCGDPTEADINAILTPGVDWEQHCQDTKAVPDEETDISFLPSQWLPHVMLQLENNEPSMVSLQFPWNTINGRCAAARC